VCASKASTNEQMDETAKVEQYLKDLLTVMVSRAEKEVDAIMPGYTHLQVSFGSLPLLPTPPFPLPFPLRYHPPRHHSTGHADRS
jgi:hypothetical protein